MQCILACHKRRFFHIWCLPYMVYLPLLFSQGHNCHFNNQSFHCVSHPQPFRFLPLWKGTQSWLAMWPYLHALTTTYHRVMDHTWTSTADIERTQPYTKWRAAYYFPEVPITTWRVALQCPLRLTDASFIQNTMCALRLRDASFTNLTSCKQSSRFCQQNII